MFGFHELLLSAFPTRDVINIFALIKIEPWLRPWMWFGNTLRGSPKRGRGRLPHLPSFKHTTTYNPDNDLIWEYETDWTRSTSSDMRTFSPDVHM